MTDKTSVERQKRYSKRKKESGYFKLQAWIKKENAEEIREAIKKINNFEKTLDSESITL
jgi:hypothetical protein